MSQQGSTAGLPTVLQANADLAPVGSVVLPGTANQQATDNFIRANYGYMAWMLAIPELRAIAEKVVGPNGITVDQNAFDGMVRGTNWFKGSTQAMRDLAELTAEDPATAQAQLDKQMADLQTEASNMGLNLDKTTLTDMATQGIAYSWDKQMTDHALYAEATRQAFAGVGGFGHLSMLGDASNPGNLTGSGTDNLGLGANTHTGYAHKGPMAQMTGDPFHGGTLSDFYDKVMAQANQYMVTVSPATATQWAIGWATGQLDPTAIDGNLLSLAIGKFPTLKPQLEGGMTPAQMFDPIKQEVSKLWEQSPDTINWQDPRFNQLWQNPDQTTGTLRPMTITEAQNWARSQNDYRTTATAQQQGASVFKALSTQMGLTKF